MLTAAVVYAVVMSLVIAGVALLTERAAAAMQRPLRWLWLAAMLLMLVAPALMLVVGAARPSVPVPPIAVTLPDFATEMSPMTDAAPTSDAHVTAHAVALDASWRALLADLAEHTAAYDGVLLALWVGASVSLALLALRGVARLRRLSRAMPEQSVQGTTVRVSDGLGPAAIGGRASAIVVPRWALQLDDALLALVLRHEQEHLRAGDPRLLGVGLALLVLAPWHLPLWWAWRRLRLAIELDCDARVLRGAASPRVYAQLLLFMSQHRRPTRARSLGDALAVPLLLAFNPRLHHLTRRIDAMTTRRVSHPVRLLGLVGASVGTATLAMAIPAPALTRAAVVPPLAEASRLMVDDSLRAVGGADSLARAATMTRLVPAATRVPVIAKVTKLGVDLADVPTVGSPALEILIYGSGPVRVGIGTAAPSPLRDTLRLDHLPAFTADITHGDLHVEMRQSAGTIELGGEVIGGPARLFSVRGRHVILAKGGMGVRFGGPSASGAVRDRSSTDSLLARRPAESDDVPTTEELDRRLAALNQAVTVFGAPGQASETIAAIRRMNRAGLPSAERAALAKRLNALQSVYLVDSVVALRRRLDSAAARQRVTRDTLGARELRSRVNPAAGDAPRADTLAARKATLEVRRATLLTTYEAWAEPVQQLNAELREIDQAIRALPPAASSRAILAVLRAIDGRRDALIADYLQLKVKFESFATPVRQNAAERQQLDERDRALRKEWGVLVPIRRGA